jgi:hypothetical protein
MLIMAPANTRILIAESFSSEKISKCDCFGKYSVVAFGLGTTG